MVALWQITDPEERAHFQRVRDLSDVLGTHDDPGIERALKALMEDRPAYWRNTGYGDQWTGPFLYYLNQSDSFAFAYSWYCREHQIEGVDERKLLHVLDHLIPLNDAAISDLGKAYAKLGTFRDDLEDREGKAYGEAHLRNLYLPPDTLAAARARFAERVEAADERARVHVEAAGLAMFSEREGV